MKVRIVHTTDGKFRGQEFDLQGASAEEIGRVSGRSFTPDSIRVSDQQVTVQSSHYTLIAKILED